MLTISTLENTSSGVLYEIPAGKPNPKQKCNVGEDTRDRVLQSAYKGNTCWYYTLNFLRKRIGNDPPEELRKESEIEKLCSQRRKAQTNHENSLPVTVTLLSTQIGLKTLRAIDFEEAKLFIEKRNAIQPILDSAEALEGQPSRFAFIKEFLKQKKHKNMLDFLLEKKFSRRNEINIKFLSSLNINVEKLFTEEMSEKNGYQKRNWENLDVVEKGGILDYFARDVSAKAYGLKRSSWAPSKGIEGLIEELKKNGPLFVGGAIGRSAYIDEPFKMSQKLAGRDIYAWRPGAKRYIIAFSCHAVLLVGAKKIQDKTYAYFIDCIDPSDPKDKSKQKIYMVSFANLTSHICDLHGRMAQNSPVAYAYYGNFKI
ncbi:MAG: hypothetical protein ACXWM2_04245 [Parachlamydiaceae bacterium]